MEDKKLYSCYVENPEGEMLDISELFYMIKNYYLVEIPLDYWLYIRQWKDTKKEDVIIEDHGMERKVSLKFWDIYLSDWEKILDKRQGRWEEDLEKWIDHCYKFTKKSLFEYLDWISFSEEEIEAGCIVGAIEDYYREYVEENEAFSPSYWELAFYTELSEEYLKQKKLVQNYNF